HARFERRGNAVFLEDFGSLSGTHVNGQRAAQYGPLEIGDEIVVGPCLLRVLNIHGDALTDVMTSSGQAPLVTYTEGSAASQLAPVGMHDKPQPQGCVRITQPTE